MKKFLSNLFSQKQTPNTNNFPESTLYDYIRKGKLEELFKIINDSDDAISNNDEINHKIISLQNRYSTLQKEHGTITEQDRVIEHNKIVQSLLNVINKNFSSDTINNKFDLFIYKDNFRKEYEQRLNQKIGNGKKQELNYQKEDETQTKDIVSELESNKRILIQGGSASGKSTALLQIAIDILSNPEIAIDILSNPESESKENNKPSLKGRLPIILNLEKYKPFAKKLTFREWLEDYLSFGYGFSEEFSRKAVRDNSLVLLIDGFDSLSDSENENDDEKKIFAKSLNAYWREANAKESEPMLVICLQKNYDYFCKTEFKFTSYSLPTKKDTNLLLDNMKEYIEQIPRIDKEDPNKNDQKEAEVITIFVEDRLKHTPFENFSAGESNDHLIEKLNTSKKYLTWIAQHFNNNQSFELIDFQPRMLKYGIFYPFFCAVLFGFLGIFSGIFIDASDGVANTSTYNNEKGVIVVVEALEDKIKNIADFTGQCTPENSGIRGRFIFNNVSYKIQGVLDGLFVGMLIGVLIGLLISLQPIKTKDRLKLSFIKSRYKITILLLTLIAFFVIGIYLYIFYEQMTCINEIVKYINVNIGICFFMVFSIYIIKFISNYLKISLNKRNQKSNRNNYFFIYSLFYGLLVAFFMFFITYIPELSLCWTLLIVLILISILIPAFAFLIVGYIFSEIEDLFEQVYTVRTFSQIQEPYQRLSSNKLASIVQVSFAAFGALTVLTILLKFDYFAEVYENNSLIENSLLIGSLLLNFIAVGYLTTPIVRHLILRFCLWLEGSLPINLVDFLNYATEARILEKEGGQWKFRHHTLYEYFRDLK
ncbi:MAG TPA: hypothetical protein PK230_02130 [Chitinophagales bacterium]|nr:hypothetical protein [Chitinophagales bacterium]